MNSPPPTNTALPVWQLALYSLTWAALLALSAAINLLWRERVLEQKSQLLITFFALGALLAFPIAYLFLRRFLNFKRTSQRFSAAFLVLGILTIALTSAVFAFHFRLYFAQWHDDEFSTRLMLETMFTILSAVYQFLVLGLRLYLPLGIIALLGASWAIATKRI